MAEQLSVEGIQAFLAQPNKAIRKRALAIILNHEMIEAEDVLREYLGNETDPELQMVGRKVLQRLQEYQEMSDTMQPEFVVPLLKSPVPEARIRALRRLLRKKTPTLATLIQQYCPMETVPEAGLLIMTILNNNPHPGNLPLILGFLESPSPRLRAEAFKGLQILIYRSLLPLFFKGLIDPAQEIRVMTLQMVKQFPRPTLLQAIEQMLASPGEVSQLAAKILSNMQGADLLPIIQRHLHHPDQTTALFLQTFYKHLGGAPVPPPATTTPTAAPARPPAPETAAAAAQPAPPPPPPPGPTPEELRARAMAEFLAGLGRALKESWPAAPDLFLRPLTAAAPPQGPHDVMAVIRQIFDRIRFFLTIGTIALYLKKGNRTLTADRVCFRAIQHGFLSVNTLQLLQALAPAFPEPAGTGDLFPLVLSRLCRLDEDEVVFEPFLSLQEGFALLDDHPEEVGNFLPAASDSLVQLLGNLAPALGPNRLLVKRMLPDGIKVFNFFAPVPIAIDPKAVPAIPLPTNFGVLISQDSLNHIVLGPYLRYDETKAAMVFGQVEEQPLFDFLKKYEAHETYLSYLSEAGND